MLITIITSTFNAARTLQKCIDSVANQTYPNIEHIIIDGASADGTPSLIQHNAEKIGSRISYWSSEPDSGIYDAWNKALPHIKGEWVLFLGADDWLYDDESISRMVPHLENAYPKYIIVYGKMVHDNKRSQAIWGEEWDKIKDGMGYKMLLPHPATFHNKALFDSGNQFDTDYKIAGDFEFLTRVIFPSNIEKVSFVDSMVTLMNVGGISSAPSLRRLREDKQVATRNGYHIPFWHPYYMSLKVRTFNLIMSMFKGKSHEIAGSLIRKLFRSRSMKKHHTIL